MMTAKESKVETSGHAEMDAHTYRGYQHAARCFTGRYPHGIGQAEEDIKNDEHNGMIIVQYQLLNIHINTVYIYIYKVQCTEMTG